MYRPFRNAALFLGSILLPIAGFLFIAFGPFGCERWPVERGNWEPTPDPFTPEPPSPHSVLDPWDASVPPTPRPGARPILTDPNARKPSEIVGDLRFYVPYQVQGLAVSPDGKLVACSGGRHFVTLFNTDTGLEVGKLYTPNSDGIGIGRLAFSPDSKRLYSSRYVWDVADRRGLARLYHPIDWALSGDGKILATLEHVGVKWVGSGPVPALMVTRPVVRFRDTGTWKEAEAFAAPGNLSLALSPDARHVVIGGRDGVVSVWDRTARKELAPLTGLSEKVPDKPAHFQPEVARLVFSPGGAMLAGVGGSEYVTQYLDLWKWPAGELAHRITLNQHKPWALAFTDDSRRIVAIAHGRSTVWDVTAGALLGERLQEKHGSSYGPAALAPNGGHLYAAGPGWRLQKVSIPDLKPIDLEPSAKVTRAELPFEVQPQLPPSQDRVLLDGTVLRQGGAGSYGVVHLNPKGKPIHHFAEGCSVAFDVAEDGTRLATHGYRIGAEKQRTPTLKVWHIASGAVEASLPVDTSPSLVRLSPDGKRLATQHSGGLVRIWDIAAKKPVLTLSADGYAVYELAFSRDGRFLVGGHGNAPAVIWDLTEAK